MTYLYLLSLLTLVAYIGYALKVCGLPASLSDTYYILKEKHRPSWLFQLAMVLCPMLLVPVWLELSSDSVQLEKGSLRWNYSSRIGHYLVAAVPAGNGVVCECLYWIVGYWINYEFKF